MITRWVRGVIDYAAQHAADIARQHRIGVATHALARPPSVYGVTLLGQSVERVHHPEPMPEELDLPQWRDADKPRVIVIGDARMPRADGTVTLRLSAHRAFRLMSLEAYGPDDLCLTQWSHGQNYLLSSVPFAVPWGQRLFSALELEERGLIMQPGVEMVFRLAPAEVSQ